jgi:hypothetical protein
MTNPRGRSFLSYSQKDKADAKKLIEAQHELGIPTWQDVDDLEIGWIDGELRKALANPDTANVLLWATPHALESSWVQQLEAPTLARRLEAEDGFFFLPVAAGVPRATMAEKLRLAFAPRDLAHHWSIEQPSANITAGGARKIAGKILQQRLKALDRHLPPGEPLRIRLSTFAKPASDAAYALSLDWSHCFGPGDPRLAVPGAWQKSLLPALNELRQGIVRHACRRLEVQGQASLSAFMAFGAEFRAVTAIPTVFHQRTTGQPPCDLSLDDAPLPVDVDIETTPGEPGGRKLAILISINSDVEHDALRALDPQDLHAILRVAHRGADDQVVPLRLEEAGQFTALARRIVDAVRTTVAASPAIQELHWFIAAPNGLCFLLGQLTNTLPESHLYEHLRGERRYVPSVVLR